MHAREHTHAHTRSSSHPVGHTDSAQSSGRARPVTTRAGEVEEGWTHSEADPVLPVALPGKPSLQPVFAFHHRP